MRVISDLLLLLLPRPCPCGEAAGPACSLCRGELIGAPRAVLPYPAPAGLPACAAAAQYRGRVRRLLIAYKERGRRDLAPVLSLALVQAVLVLPVVQAALAASSAGSSGRLLLVPVPPSKAAWRARGVDHMATLVRGSLPLLRQSVRAAGSGKSPSLSVSWAPLLQLTRRVADQGGLAAASRASNLRGALRLREAARFLPAHGMAGPALLVVLVDDVLTTGATMAEAARALAAGGVRAHGAAAIAAAVRHDTAAARQHPVATLSPLGERG